MTQYDSRRPDPLCYLPHEGREFEGRPPKDAISPEIAERNADLAIRRIMAAQKREMNRNSLPELAPADPQAGAGAVPGRPRRAVRGSRRTGRLAMLAVIALVMVWRPWLLPSVLFGVFFFVLITYLTIGPDRVAELVAGAWHRLARRRPALAETIRCRADAAARRVDGLLDRLPGNWAGRLALPDLSTPRDRAATAEDLPDPFERLAARQAGN